MADEKSSSVDLIGIKPVGEAFKSIVDGSISGAAAFLSRICLPAAEEFGLLLRDKVGAWRAANLLRIAEKAERKIDPADGGVCAHPRVIMKAIEDGSWTEDEDVQELWAGLLASSCTPDGKDDSNLLFVNILGQLSIPQAKIVKYSCEHARKYLTAAGWVAAEYLSVTLDQLQSIASVNDFQRLDRELDHLRALELLIEGGFEPDSTDAVVTPSALAMHLYVRCQGFRGSPDEFFQLQPRDNHRPKVELAE